MSLRRAIVIAVAFGAASAALPADAGATQLSNERTVTRWAYANELVPARVFPSRHAQKIKYGRLRSNTEDGLPEIYLVLESRWRGSQQWVRVRLPMRPNGRKGWVRREALGAFHVVHTALRVNRRTLRATLYRDGRKIWRSPVGVGRPGMETPAGRFWIRERLRGFGATYGPVAFGTAAYSRLSEWPGGGVVGIHGTNEPGLIPGRPSHGCIRVPNAKIRQLARLMPLGTPIHIV